MAENKAPKLVVDQTLEEEKVEAEVRTTTEDARDHAPTVQVDVADAADTDSPKDDGPSAHIEPPTAKGAMRSFAAWLRRTFPGHEHAFVGGACGLLLAFLVFTLGFLRTLFVVLLMAIGVAVGQYLDGDPRLVQAIKRLFGDGQ